MPIIYREECLKKQYLNEVLSLSFENPDFYNENKDLYLSCLEKSSAKINDIVIKSFFHPYILSNSDFMWIKEKTETLWGILEKTAQLLLTEKEVRDFFDFPTELVELLQVDPKYPINVPVTRFDAFFNKDNSLYFCEFNADGTSGMNETNTMEECFLDTEMGRHLVNKYSLNHCELRKSLLSTLLENYRFFDASNKPVIAIVDFMDKATIAEFEALKNAFIEEGYNTLICDIRNFSYKNNKLWYNGKSIDLVYRRAVTSDILARYNEVQEFIKAYKNNAFCLVGSFRSEAAHSKLVFTFLTSETAEKFFSHEEIKFLKTHLPKTSKLISKDKLLNAEIFSQRESYLIKPHNSYGGQGLYIGRDCSLKEWQNIIEQNIDKNYIVQEVIKVPQEEFVVSQGTIEKLKVNLSPYLFNGKLTGFYTRVSTIDIITTSLGGALIPTFVQQGTRT